MLLTRLQWGGVLICRTFPIHAEPDHRNDEARESGGAILRNLPTAF
jgi:hypothetical protein